jgi:YHS domain-containing protein
MALGRRKQFLLNLSARMSTSEAVNATCPWSGNPVQADSLTTYKDNVVGFCNSGCRDKFVAAVNAFETALINAPSENGNTSGTINDMCPWSGNPVQDDSLTNYKGKVVGFCNSGCRDKFAVAMTAFESAMAN